MRESDSATRTVRLSRVFDAPIDLVYQAWADAKHVIKWMKCDVQAILEVENWVPSVGTKFTTYMAQTGVFETRCTGYFSEVDPPHVLEFVYDANPSLGVPEMRVRVELEALGGKTRLTLSQSGIPNDMLFGVIEAGWTSSLSQLQGAVESAQRATAITEQKP